MEQKEKLQTATGAAVIMATAAIVLSCLLIGSKGENKKLTREAERQAEKIDSMAGAATIQAATIYRQAEVIRRDSTTIAIYRQSCSDIAVYSEKILEIIKAAKSK